MIYLPDVAKKLEDILNSANLNQIVNPNGYLYKVATTGFHLDKNYDKEEGKNFIPVFIDTMGGNYDAVQNIKRSVKNIPVVIYFPVRFKNDFFAIDEFLVDTFVAKIIDFGGVTGKGLCNISVSQYGEIQDFDLKNFSTWVETLYKKSISVTEPYMSMTFTIYITTQSAEFVLGNSITYNLKMHVEYTPYFLTAGILKDIKWIRKESKDVTVSDVDYYAWADGNLTLYTTTLTPSQDSTFYGKLGQTMVPQTVYFLSFDNGSHNYSEDLVWTSSGTGANNSPIAQQLVDADSFTKNVINITNYNKSIVAYVKDNEFWHELLKHYNEQTLNEITSMELTKTYHLASGNRTYNFNQLALSFNENISLGDLISMTIVFGDKKDE